MLTLAIMLGAGLAMAGGAQRARACSCIGWTDAEAFANVDVVFRGTLASNDPRDADSPATEDVFELDFAVERVFKGEAAVRQTVFTPGESSSCAFPGQVGLEYLVFAARGETALIEVGGSDLTTNLCAGTRATSADAATPASFGPGVAPLARAERPTAPTDDDDGGLSAAWVAVLAALALVAGVGTLVTFRRR